MHLLEINRWECRQTMLTTDRAITCQYSTPEWFCCWLDDRLFYTYLWSYIIVEMIFNKHIIWNYYRLFSRSCFVGCVNAGWHAISAIYRGDIHASQWSLGLLAILISTRRVDAVAICGRFMFSCDGHVGHWNSRQNEMSVCAIHLQCSSSRDGLWICGSDSVCWIAVCVSRFIDVMDGGCNLLCVFSCMVDFAKMSRKRGRKSC